MSMDKKKFWQSSYQEQTNLLCEKRQQLFERQMQLETERKQLFERQMQLETERKQLFERQMQISNDIMIKSDSLGVGETLDNAFP